MPEENANNQANSTKIPWKKILFFLLKGLILIFVGCAIYASFNGYFIEVLIISLVLTILIGLLGIYLDKSIEIPIWKIASILILPLGIGYGVYECFNGHYVEVLSVFTGLILFIGIIAIIEAKSIEIPLWKIILFLIILFAFDYAIYESFNGHFMKVLSILTGFIFLIGLVLVFIFLISKELFFWLIGKKSEYQKLYKAYNNVSTKSANLLIDRLPSDLDKNEKEQIKEDVPKVVDFTLTSTINGYIIRAFTGIFATAFALLGTVVVINQNELITKQNKRLDQQTYLQEAERRSSLVFLFSNVMDAIDEELKTDVGTKGKRDLSPQLTGRIIALSTRLKPYNYMDGDTLIDKPLSPERGQLLVSLIESEIDTTTLTQIFKRGDFSYADLKNAELNGVYLRYVKLSNSDLSYANLNDAMLENADLTESQLKEAILHNANLKAANMTGANLINSEIINADMRNITMTNTNLRGAKLQRSDISALSKVFSGFTYSNYKGTNTLLNNSDLTGANLSGANLTNVFLQNSNLSKSNLTNAILKNASLHNIELDSAIVSPNFLQNIREDSTEPDSLNLEIIKNYKVHSYEKNVKVFDNKFDIKERRIDTIYILKKVN